MTMLRGKFKINLLDFREQKYIRTDFELTGKLCKNAVDTLAKCVLTLLQPGFD